MQDDLITYRTVANISHYTKPTNISYCSKHKNQDIRPYKISHSLKLSDVILHG